MKQWNELGPSVLKVMKMLGDFSPTSNIHDREVKGYTYEDGEGGKCYWSSSQLREMAVSLIDVADWLDERSFEATCKEEVPPLFNIPPVVYRMMGGHGK